MSGSQPSADASPAGSVASYAPPASSDPGAVLEEARERVERSRRASRIERRASLRRGEMSLEEMLDSLPTDLMREPSNVAELVGREQQQERRPSTVVPPEVVAAQNREVAARQLGAAMAPTLGIAPGLETGNAKFPNLGWTVLKAATRFAIKSARIRNRGAGTVARRSAAPSPDGELVVAHSEPESPKLPQV